jgi:hypothetical protein
MYLHPSYASPHLLALLRRISELRTPVSQGVNLRLTQPNNSAIPLTPLPLLILPLRVRNPECCEKARDNLCTEIYVMPTVIVRFVLLEICPSGDNGARTTQSDDVTTAYGSDRSTGGIVEAPREECWSLGKCTGCSEETETC